MKGAGVIFLVFLLWLAYPGQAQAADFSMLEELELETVESYVEEILGGSFDFQDTVRQLVLGGQPFGVEDFLGAVVTQIRENWRNGKEILFSILLLGIAAALFHNFSDIFQNQQIAEVSFEVTYMLLFLILLQVFSGAKELTQEVVLRMQEFMRVLIPSYFLAVSMTGAVTTAAVFYPFLLWLIYVIQWVILRILLPLIQVYLVLVFVNHLSREEYLSRMSGLVEKVCVWLLKSMLAVVVGFHTLQGILAPAVDAFKGGTLSRILGMLPGVGNLAGGVTDVILGSAVLIKNGIGAAGLLVLLFLCLAPLVRLGSLLVLLEFSAAFMQPASDKRMIGCVAGTASGIGLLFRVVFTVALLFMLTLVVVMVSAGGLR